jgi:hypothetical protein
MLWYKIWSVFSWSQSNPWTHIGRSNWLKTYTHYEVISPWIHYLRREVLTTLTVSIMSCVMSTRLHGLHDITSQKPVIFIRSWFSSPVKCGKTSGLSNTNAFIISWSMVLIFIWCAVSLTNELSDSSEQANSLEADSTSSAQNISRILWSTVSFAFMTTGTLLDSSPLY